MKDNGTPTSSINSICVYCGSGSGQNPRYAEAARALGRAMAQANIRLIFGGGSSGLMGNNDKAALCK